MKKLTTLEITWFDNSKTLLDAWRWSAVYWNNGQLAIDITHPEGDTEIFKEIKSVRVIRTNR